MQAKRDKEMWEQTLCLKHFDFDEFRGPFKMGPKGQKCSFGDRNIIFGRPLNFYFILRQFFRGRGGAIGGCEGAHFFLLKVKFRVGGRAPECLFYT